MSKQLELKFTNTSGTTNTISIEEPVEPVDAAAIHEAMTYFVTNDVFHTSGGSFVAIKEARIVERTVEEIELP
ncbi:DUF2922 domain-containing protein [Aureibacillus halotolerans]|uniref:DUF2922 family protein n=1 Tax=Aureibacillus halotolerans TaxID=1508390 RepID=A0A4R6UB91_9BACI|nr:DUF2922 domain-containing protein [Aureibacillus halotolerans]TDQ41995.1 DUF2922 family protein [Aureibacillus halotolerans]